MREIEVWAGLDGKRQAGVLSTRQVHGKDIFSFAYTDTWLTGRNIHLLDPDLRLFRGPQYTSPEKSNFGLFLDSSPDRWGRLLMRRREAINARKEKRPVKNLSESDFLMGVYDENRMGALRFREVG
jgi:serine/threonine-protein kinase HipA